MEQRDDNRVERGLRAALYGVILALIIAALALGDGATCGHIAAVVLPIVAVSFIVGYAVRETE